MLVARHCTMFTITNHYWNILLFYQLTQRDIGS